MGLGDQRSTRHLQKVHVFGVGVGEVRDLVAIAGTIGVPERGIWPSIGVDAWGVDWALVGKSGELLALPHCYRDPQNEPALQRVVDAPATPITETITVTADGIEEIDASFAAPLFPANDAFNAWMRANHPEDAAAADCCSEDGSIEEARADGELRRQYADLWAAYLGENGCTYNDIGC